MRIQKITYSLILVLALHSVVQAQKKIWLNFAIEAQADRDFYSASNFYRKALSYDTLDLDIQYQMAKCFLGYYQLDSALAYFNKIKKSDKISIYGETDFYIAQIFKYQGKYLEAKNNFDYFRRNYKGTDNYLPQFAANEVKCYPKIRDLIKDTNELKTKPLPGNVNTEVAEFGVSMYLDTTLFFSSLKNIATTTDGWMEYKKAYTSKIYLAHLKDSVWVFNDTVALTIDKNMDVVNPFWDAKDSVLYFSACVKGICDLFSAKIKNNQLVECKKLDINLDGFTSTQPNIAWLNGKKYLIFSSNRPNGKGNMDLWMSVQQGKTWGEPLNLGPLVNTQGNEVTPFYSAKNNQLFFSSDWHCGIGGMDIFQSEYIGNKFKGVQNLGAPFNSSRNDLYYVHQETQAFLSSNRLSSNHKNQEQCCNDIFEIKWQKNDTIKDTLPIDSAMIVQKNLRLLLEEYPVRLFFHNDIPNPRSWDTLTSLNYQTTYDAYIRLQSEYKKEYPSSLAKKYRANAEVLIDSFFVHHVQKGYADVVFFANLLYPYLEQGYSIKLTAKGFASPLARNDYNVNLSKRRINSFKNYLIELPDKNYNQYLNNTAPNGAQLIIQTLPNGEELSNPFVSDNYYDVRNSIYNPAAAFERRVEVEDVILLKMP